VLEYELDPSLQIKLLKTLIESRERSVHKICQFPESDTRDRIPAEMQKFKFNGEALYDGMSFSYYNIPDNGVLELVMYDRYSQSEVRPTLPVDSD